MPVNNEDNIDKVMDLLRDVFKMQMSRLQDHEEFKDISEGGIKVYVKPSEDESA